MTTKQEERDDGRSGYNGRRVLVIGAGVSGLTSALCLRRRGYSVTVVAEHFAPRVTSVVAGALWEWPPAVCGHHLDADSLARSKAWSETSYQIFADLARDPATGVFVRPVTFYFKRPVAENPRQDAKMNELKDKVREFRHDAGLIAENGINGAIGLCDAYTHLAPMIDTDVYLKWLMDEIRNAHCRILEGKISGALREQEDALKRRYEADAIINCAGLGARVLARDAMSPLRGALIRVRNDGTKMPRLDQGHCVSREAGDDESGFIFIIPRGDDMLLLGGLAEHDEWDTDVGLHNHEPIREMLARCVAFLPALKDAEIDAAEPVRVGLRPYRARNVRLEREAGTQIFHNYGHSGSGVTFSWGCALEISNRVDASLRNC
jgi:D-amino-acid oxidase